MVSASEMPSSSTTADWASRGVLWPPTSAASRGAAVVAPASAGTSCVERACLTCRTNDDCTAPPVGWAACEAEGAALAARETETDRANRLCATTGEASERGSARRGRELAPEPSPPSPPTPTATAPPLST